MWLGLSRRVSGGSEFHTFDAVWRILIRGFSADRWFKMDDTKVSEVAEEDILKLSGGGEYHSAYILLYGPRRILKVTPESPMDVD